MSRIISWWMHNSHWPQCNTCGSPTEARSSCPAWRMSCRLWRNKRSLWMSLSQQNGSVRWWQLRSKHRQIESVSRPPKDLNKVIKRPHYPSPTLDDVTSKLAGACYYSVMDARSGYWAMKLIRSRPSWLHSTQSLDDIDSAACFSEWNLPRKSRYNLWRSAESHSNSQWHPHLWQDQGRAQ